MDDIKSITSSLTTNLKNTNTKMILYTGFFLIMIIITLVLYKLNEQIDKFSYLNYIYLLIIIIPFLIFYIFSKQITSDTTIHTEINFSMIIMASIAIIVIIFGALYIYSNLSLQDIVITGYVLGIVMTIIVIIFLSIIFTIIGTQFRTYTGWSGILIRLLFYIPCLLIDFVEYIKQQYKLTTNTTYILFISELVFLLFYLYFPKLAHLILKGTYGKSILPDSRFLIYEHVFSINDLLIKNKETNKDTGVTKTTYIEDYAISFWTYINPQATSYSGYANETNVLTMGNNTPKITYYNKPDDKNMRNQLVFHHNDQTYTVTNEPQKWTNIVLNYTSTNLDIFINGELKISFTIEHPVIYTPPNEIIIGSKNGLDGAICNIAFYNKTLTKFEINNNYNLLKNNNPPVKDY
jgi:hypothetical protein